MTAVARRRLPTGSSEQPGVDSYKCSIGPIGLFLCLTFGKWRSLVAHLLWEQGVAGSNPVFPTTQFQGFRQ